MPVRYCKMCGFAFDPEEDETHDKQYCEACFELQIAVAAKRFEEENND